MKLGQNIKRLRKEKGISQEALADAIGVSRQAVSKWETDVSVPELEKLLKLSELFGVTLDELVGYEDDESLELLTQYLNESGASVAMMEQNDQSQNLVWPGVEELLDNTG